MLPVASVDYKNVLYQYIGSTTREYIHNYYYECVLDGNSYVWVRRDVQPTSSRKILVPIPEVTVGTYTYNGEAQGPAVKGLELPRLNITNETATNAGEYSLTVGLKNPNTTIFEDGGSSDKTFDYVINKISQNIIISSDTVEFDNDHVEFEIDVTGVLTSLSVLVDDESIVTATNTNDKIILTGTGTNGIASVTVYAVGDENYSASQILTIDITTDYHVVLKGFGEATDKELVDMVAAADRGEIDLYEDAGWRVGDERTIHINSVSDNELFLTRGAVGETDAILVLVAKNNYELTNPINNKTRCSFVWQLKQAWGKNSIKYDLDRTKLNWSEFAIRTWLNTDFYNALPTSIKQITKNVVVYSSAKHGDATSLVQTNDNLFFPTYKELFGNGSKASSIADSQKTEYFSEYYYDNNQRKKYKIPQDTTRPAYQKWGLRSPNAIYSSGETSFVSVDTGGTQGTVGTNSGCYVSPCGCI